MDNDKLIEVNPIFERCARDGGFYSKELMEKIAEHGTVKGNLEVPVHLRNIFVTAHDITPDVHIRMQAAFQKHTDNAVSKTVNLPKEADVSDVREIYDMAYNLKCKGVTIYRDGSKDNQVLSFSSNKTEEKEDGFQRAVRDRPEILEGFTTKIKTGM